jgi:hypothetical protein
MTPFRRAVMVRRGLEEGGAWSAAQPGGRRVCDVNGSGRARLLRVMAVILPRGGGP